MALHWMHLDNESKWQCTSLHLQDTWPHTDSNTKLRAHKREGRVRASREREKEREKKDREGKEERKTERERQMKKDITDKLWQM